MLQSFDKRSRLGPRQFDQCGLELKRLELGPALLLLYTFAVCLNATNCCDPTPAWQPAEPNLHPGGHRVWPDKLQFVQGVAGLSFTQQPDCPLGDLR